MQDNKSVLLKADGKNEDIELTETTVKVIYYKKELFKKTDKSKIENVEEIPRDSIIEARIISKGSFQILIPSESNPKSHCYFLIYFNPEQTPKFEKMVEEIGRQGFWYEDNSKLGHTESYENEEQASIDADGAAKKGWRPQSSSAIEGHINIGRTVAKTILTGGIGLAVSGRSRTKGKMTITYERTPEWLSSHNKAVSQLSALSQATGPQPADDPLQKMKQLKGMLDAGLVTESEYSAKKADLLSKM